MEKPILTEEEKQRLVSFFEILIEVDKRERITDIAKEIYGPKENKETGGKDSRSLKKGVSEKI